MGKPTKGQRTTPKKERTEEQEEPQVPQIPARPCQIRVVAINDDYILMTVTADMAMSVNNYTVGYEQWEEIYQGVEPWRTMERTPPETESGLTVVTQSKALVGPNGQPIASKRESAREGGPEGGS